MYTIISIKIKICKITRSFNGLPQNHKKDGVKRHQNDNLSYLWGKIVDLNFKFQTYLEQNNTNYYFSVLYANNYI